jgi:WhiB family redox-sensing transcriptional regulator
VTATAARHPELDSWEDLAACHGRTPLFYAGDAFSNRLAVAVCNRCPVRGECLADALAVEAITGVYGVRGGLTPAERCALVGDGR